MQEQERRPYEEHPAGLQPSVDCWLSDGRQFYPTEYKYTASLEHILH